MLVSIGIFFLAADQAIKFFLVHFLKPNESIPIIKNILHITLVFNTGCAFGLFKSQPTLIFIIISLTAVIFFIYFLKHIKRSYVFTQLGLILLISGSVSNLIDRFRFGYVIDFLDFRIWPVFNLGDTAITIGVSIFILQLFLKNAPDTL